MLDEFVKGWSAVTQAGQAARANNQDYEIRGVQLAESRRKLKEEQDDRDSVNKYLQLGMQPEPVAPQAAAGAPPMQAGVMQSAAPMSAAPMSAAPMSAAPMSAAPLGVMPPDLQGPPELPSMPTAQPMPEKVEVTARKQDPFAQYSRAIDLATGEGNMRAAEALRKRLSSAQSDDLLVRGQVIDRDHQALKRDITTARLQAEKNGLPYEVDTATIGKLGAFQQAQMQFVADTMFLSLNPLTKAAALKAWNANKSMFDGTDDVADITIDPATRQITLINKQGKPVMFGGQPATFDPEAVKQLMQRSRFFAPKTGKYSATKTEDGGLVVLNETTGDTRQALAPSLDYVSPSAARREEMARAGRSETRAAGADGRASQKLVSDEVEVALGIVNDRINGIITPENVKFGPAVKQRAYELSQSGMSELQAARQAASEFYRGKELEKAGIKTPGRMAPAPAASPGTAPGAAPGAAPATAGTNDDPRRFFR
jgi:hypothetical protein